MDYYADMAQHIKTIQYFMCFKKVASGLRCLSIDEKEDIVILDLN